MTRRLLLVFLFGFSTAWAGRWIRVTSPHFEIFTDTNPRTAQRVLTRFEQAREVLSSSGGWEHISELPTRVVLFSSEKEYSTLRPAQNAKGFYQSGPDRDYIVMMSDSELDRVVLHEYTHAALNHASGPLPQWLEEGLAEFYSTLAIRTNRLTVGQPIPAHVMILDSQDWLSADVLLQVDQKSSYYNESGKTGIFYAQSWALTHMLMFGDGYRGKLGAFLEALAAGEPQEDAFQQAFGKTSEAALSDLHAYIHKPFRVAAVKMGAVGDILFSDPAPLDPEDVLQARGEILLLMKRDAEAAAVYRQMVKRYPDSAAAHSGMAVIAMRDHDLAKARASYEEAVRLGAKDASTYFEYAMLLRESGAPAEQVSEYLNKTVEANPSHAEAHFLLGVRASDAGEYSAAVEHLRRATEVLPRQAYFWQALAYAYLKLGRNAEARPAALRALRAARTEHELDAARTTLDLIDHPAADPLPPAKAGVITPDSWKNQQGDRSADGKLTRVDCLGKSARLVIETATGILILGVRDAGSVVIRGSGPRHTLSCGAQSGVMVGVDYLAATNEVTAIEFR